jgi:hypothetical protein
MMVVTIMIFNFILIFFQSFFLRRHTRVSKLFVLDRLEWGEPYAGKGTDTFVLSNNGSRLTQISEMEFTDESKNCTYHTVYSRWHGDRS